MYTYIFIHLFLPAKRGKYISLSCDREQNQSKLIRCIVDGRRDDRCEAIDLKNQLSKCPNAAPTKLLRVRGLAPSRRPGLAYSWNVRRIYQGTQVAGALCVLL